MSALSPWDKRLKRGAMVQLRLVLNFNRPCFFETCAAIGLCKHREPELLPDAEWREA